MRLSEVEGVNELIVNLKTRSKRMAFLVEKGLKLGGLFLQRASQEMVPREYGFLVNSAFTRKTKGRGFTAEITVGYTAHYALYVHENERQKLKGTPRPSGLGVYWGPLGAGPKFLEKPAREKAKEIVEKVQKEVRRA